MATAAVTAAHVARRPPCAGASLCGVRRARARLANAKKSVKTQRGKSRILTLTNSKLRQQQKTLRSSSRTFCSPLVGLIEMRIVRAPPPSSRSTPFNSCAGAPRRDIAAPPPLPPLPPLVCSRHAPLKSRRFAFVIIVYWR